MRLHLFYHAGRHPVKLRRVHLDQLEQGWAEGALGRYVPRLRWLVARRGKTLGPQVADSKYDWKHFWILSGVACRLGLLQELKKQKHACCRRRRDDLSVPGLGPFQRAASRRACGEARVERRRAKTKRAKPFPVR